MAEPTSADRVIARERAQRIAELHPPVDGRWVADRCPPWIMQITEIVAVALADQRAALLTDPHADCDTDMRGLWAEIEGLRARLAPTAERVERLARVYHDEAGIDQTYDALHGRDRDRVRDGMRAVLAALAAEPA